MSSDAGSDAVVEIEGLSFGYRSRPVLEQVDLRLLPGANFVVGENGVGKTTLLRLLLGDLKPGGGTIRQPASPIGYMPQAFGFPPRFTVTEFATHFAWLYGVSRRDRARRVADALDMVGLTDRASEQMGKLSGGMLRRAGIAQALVHQPELVLLDEPTVALDPRQRVELRTVLSELAKTTTLVISTHLLEDVRDVGGQVAVLDSGRVCFAGTVDEMAERAGDGSGSLEQAFLTLTGRDEVSA